MAYHPITDIRCIGADTALILRSEGIRTTVGLLRCAKTPKQRLKIAEKVGTDDRCVLDWVTAADRMRVKGVGPDVTRLLAACGVHTVAQLKTQDATKLNDEITKVNSKSHLSENPPSVEHLQAWIAQAQTLPIVLH